MSAVPANPTGAADPADQAEPLTTGQDDGNEPEVTDPVEESEPTDDPGSDQYLADLQRVSAEFANFRKQAEKRSIEARAWARGALAERLLPVLDACDLAIEHGADGVAPIRSSLVHALEPAGLEVLDPMDQPFDPTRHEAVLHEPAEAGDDGQVVVEVLRRGYAWAGRVLRPAMVKVRG